MGTGETGPDDVPVDLVRARHHTLGAGHDERRGRRLGCGRGHGAAGPPRPRRPKTPSTDAPCTGRPLVLGLLAAATVPGDAVSALARTVAARLALETDLQVDWESGAGGTGDDGWDLTLAVVALPSIAGDQPLVTRRHDGRCGSALVGLPVTATAPPHPDAVLGDVADRLVDTLRASRFLPWRA
jgi:hypothetical protein